jgi:hypothetical protein
MVKTLAEISAEDPKAPIGKRFHIEFYSIAYPSYIIITGAKIEEGQAVSYTAGQYLKPKDIRFSPGKYRSRALIFKPDFGILVEYNQEIPSPSQKNTKNPQEPNKPKCIEEPLQEKSEEQLFSEFILRNC